MNKEIKAVFFDVDATMYYHKIHDILPSTKAALNALHERGIKVGVATSRCRYELNNTPSFFRSFPFAGIVSDGGALAMEKDQIIAAQYIDSEIVERVIAYAKKHQRTLRYSTITGDFFFEKPLQKDKDIFFQLYLNTPIVKPYANDDVLNILLYSPNYQDTAELTEILDGISWVDHGPVLEINAGQIDKSDGIAALASHWGLRMDEIMSFGDGANDVQLVKNCGIGVAMGNGCDEVKNAADFVTKRIEEDGIAFALKHFGLI